MTNENIAAERDYEAIAKRAYELYEANGSEDGHQEEHWRQAEAELYPEGSAAASARKSSKAK
jgi:hypothetical protein